MPIHIISGQDTYIPSSAARLLEQELRSYRDQKIFGRSFLIAGHRGSGKTSLVSNALRALEDEALGPLAPKPRRFLPIHIHGPSMFSVDEEAPVDGARSASQPGNAASGTATPPTGADPSPSPATGAKPAGKGEPAPAPPKGDPRLRAALEQFVLSLYRSLVDEMAKRYRERVRERLELQRSTELLERAAQLELELDEYPGPERLREFWEAGDFLESGVLFPVSVRPNLPPDQGLRELIALSSACEAFRRVSGTFEKAKEELKLSAQQEERIERTRDTTGKDLITPLVSLATGGLIGIGAATKADPLAATLTGLLAAVGTSAVFKYSASRSRGRSYTKEYTFLPNRDLATLDRALPVLVARVKAAGLVPIFVVDELDKVDDLSKRMGPMVGQLKKFVSESAFFCFLTNRDYYEYLQTLSLRQAYPIEHTYFTDRLFIVFRPDDFHQYLERIFVVPAPPPEGARPATGAPAASTVPASPTAVVRTPKVLEGSPGPGGPVAGGAATPSMEAVRERAVTEGDRDVLPYVLLQRAQMHAIDVRRQIDEILAPDGVVALAPGSIRSHLGDRLDLMIQLAIRIVLDRGELRNPMEREPAFARLAYDALFVPSRLRRNGEEELDLSDAAREQFRAELVGRMTSEKEIKTGESLEVADTDLRFLLARTRELAELLADPFALCDAMAQWERAVGRRLSTAVRDALPLLLPTGPLLSGNRDGSYKYRWGYDHLGRVIHADRRTALAYQLDVEYELAVRIVLGSDAAAKDPEVRRLLHAVLWVPYRWWREQPGAPLDRHMATDDRLRKAIDLALAPPMREQLRLTFPRTNNLRERLDTLLNALADPETFRGRLVNQGWTAAFPLITRELRPHSPVLQRPSPGEAYQWQFDLRGAALAANVEVPVTLEAEAWVQQVHFIRAAQATLQRVSGGAVHFGTLGSGINIIPSSPEWNEVEAAITRVQQSGRFGTADLDPRDLATIGQFATLLGRQGETIGLALACAAFVVEAAGSPTQPPASPGTLASGLMALASTFGLADGAERRPAVELMKALADEAAARWPDLRAGLATPPRLEPDRVGDWGSWIEEQIRAAAKTVEADRPRAIAGAWAEWQSRLEKYLRGSDTRFEPTLDDVICAVSGAGPATVLRPDLGPMTLSAWSRALHLACADAAPDDPGYVPLWVAPPALLALGLGGAAQAFVANVGKPGVFRRRVAGEAETAAGWAEAARRRTCPPERSLLVIVRSALGSVAATWAPSADVGALVIEPMAARALLVEPPALLRTSGPATFGHLVTEGLTDDDNTVLELASSVADAAKAEGRIVERWELGGTDEPNRRVRGLPRTSSLDDLLPHLVGTAAPASTVYLHILGRAATSIPEPLRNWLGQPRRRTRGLVHVERSAGPRGLLASLLLGRLRRGDYESLYEGASEETPSGVVPNDVFRLELSGLKGTFATTVEQQGAGGELVARTSDSRIRFRVGAQRDGIRLETVTFDRHTPLGLLLSLLRPRLTIVVSAQEGGFGVVAGLALGGFAAPVLRIRGDFAPESAGEPRMRRA